MQTDGYEFFKTFNTYLTLLKNPSVGEQMTTENATRAFECARFVEIAIAKVQAEGKECDFERCLRDLQRSEAGSSSEQTCSDLERACDRLLERCLKDCRISTEIVDEYLKLYVQHLGRDRLSTFLNRTMGNSIAVNMIVESLKELDIPLSCIEDEALIISWETSLANGDQVDVVKCINEMLNNGYIARLIRLMTESHDDSAIKKLVIRSLSAKMIETHPAICVAFADIKKKALAEMLKSDHEFCMNFIDAIFYFGRNMRQVDGKWLSDHDFKYEHLCKIIKTLLNSPHVINELVYNRLSIVKTQPDSEIWNDIERDVLP